jgi:hypothetical protein
VPESASQTIRYYATSQQVYARALLALVDYARTHQDDFTFGPLYLPVLEHQGLTVTSSGSGADLPGVKEMLGKVPGLTEYDAQEEQ